MNIKYIARNGLLVGMLAACGSPATPRPDVAQPTATQTESTQPAAANPASQNCVDQGGTLSIEERDLTQPKGLPGRPWFKHTIYAPGLYTGYGVQYLSALEDSLVAGDWPKVRNYRALLHNSLTTATNTARAAASFQP